jgi:transposase-like protein
MVLRPLVEAILQELLEAEMTEALGAQDATAEVRASRLGRMILRAQCDLTAGTSQRNTTRG